ncbi:hypothetical protein DRQ09_10125 [candidate division KSB1 bacterium]|nr:MAG: hypothetical protein DRQ09_10125 [candidate division KSB1 bacterium]
MEFSFLRFKLSMEKMEELFKMDRDYLATVVLTPAESKRLIGKAVANLPEVQNAFRKGKILIIGSTTNAYVVEELLGIKISKYRFAAGKIHNGKLGVNKKEERIPPYIIRNGKVLDVELDEILKEFDVNDVVIKGANAVDPYGNAGILLASKTGGSVAKVIGTIFGIGAHFIIPVGLEKLIPSVYEAAESFKLRQNQIYSTGLNVGFMPVTGAKVITEIESLEVLTSVIAVHVSSGGIGGSEGSVVLNIHGKKEEVTHAIELIKNIKGEPSINPEN